MVDRALEWLDHNRERPVFLFLHTYEVHHPYTPDLETIAGFDADYSGALPPHISVQLLRTINTARIRLEERDRLHITRAYEAEIRSVDNAFGRLIDGLVARDLYDGSLIIFTSDHGEEFGEHGMMGWHSHTLYDELLRVPLIIKRPTGAGAGTRVATQVREIDIAPTILQQVGVPIPASFAGNDLFSELPLTGQPAVSSRDVAPGEESTSIRLDRWKLYDGRLYDLSNDPGETLDVAASHPDEVRRLNERLQDVLRERPRSSPPSIVPDEALNRRLRALGYVE
jgi:arylsulfatase A-like enzyme